MVASLRTVEMLLSCFNSCFAEVLNLFSTTPPLSNCPSFQAPWLQISKLDGTLCRSKTFHVVECVKARAPWKFREACPLVKNHWFIDCICCAVGSSAEGAVALFLNRASVRFRPGERSGNVRENRHCHGRISTAGWSFANETALPSGQQQPPQMYFPVCQNDPIYQSREPCQAHKNQTRDSPRKKLTVVKGLSRVDVTWSFPDKHHRASSARGSVPRRLNENHAFFS